jgi:hypothetical protein
MAANEAPKRKWHPLRLLFVLPFIAVLWVSTYNRIEPELFGLPFFYWYQLLWVIIASIIAGLVYKAEY